MRHQTGTFDRGISEERRTNGNEPRRCSTQRTDSSYIVVENMWTWASGRKWKRGFRK